MRKNSNTTTKRRSKYQQECEKEFSTRKLYNIFYRSIKFLRVVAIVLLIAGLTYLIIPSTRNQLFSDVSSGFYNLMANAGLRVKEITLKGVEIADKTELLMALDIAENDPILGVDIEKLKNNFKDISWIKDVSVRRILPEQVEVRIIERKPIAIWQNNKTLHLIDKDGVVITEIEPNNSFKFPLIVGKNSNTTINSTLSKLYNDESLTKRIKILRRYGNRRWDVTLDNGIIVKLPPQDEDLAWKRLGDLNRKENILDRYITEIDLRYNDKVFIKLPNSEIIQTYNNNS